MNMYKITTVEPKNYSLEKVEIVYISSKFDQWILNLVATRMICVTHPIYEMLDTKLKEKMVSKYEETVINDETKNECFQLYIFNKLFYQCISVTNNDKYYLLPKFLIDEYDEIYYCNDENKSYKIVKKNNNKIGINRCTDTN